jgi:hypothetical protein
MNLSVKLDAALIALGLEPGNVEFHHQPPLSQRPIIIVGDNGAARHDPDANDPHYIVPMAREAHRERTPADISTSAKVRRVEKKQARHRAVMSAKDGLDDAPRDVKRHRIASRGFDKHHRPMRRAR